MSFAKINYLFIIWVTPLLLAFFFYGYRRRQRILNNFAAPPGLAAIVPHSSTGRRWVKAALILCAVPLIAVALAGPQYGYTWEEIEQKGVDLIIALDCSRSMLAEDIQPDRLERAKREIFDLLALLKGDRAGLTAFAGTAFLQCPLTLDYTAFNLFLNALTPDYLPVGGTDLEAAINTAVNAFDPKSSAEKAIILITDGEHTGNGDPVKAAEKAAEAGIKLFCIGVGAAEGVPIREKNGGFAKDASGRIVLSKLDEETLKRMAAKGNGIYVRSVAGDMDLDAIYIKEIRGKMASVTLAGGRRQVHQNRYQWPLFLALVLLLIERSISLIRPLRHTAPMLLAFAVLTAAMPAQGTAAEIQEGMKAYEKGDYAAAVDKFTAAQLEDPERPEILYNLGNAFYKKGDYDSAEAHLRDALPKADQELKSKIYYNLGNVDFRKGRMEEAIKNYQKSLESAPDDQQAKENIEFVKKVMQQQKQQQNQPSQDKQGQDQKEEDQKSGESQQKQDQQGTSDNSDNASQEQKKQESRQDKSSAGNSDDSKQQPQHESPSSGEPDDKEQPQSASSGQEKSEQQNEAEKHSANAQQQAQPDEQRQKLSEQLLNRLKDQPGKAIMPSYGPKSVEKDW